MKKIFIYILLIFCVLSAISFLKKDKSDSPPQDSTSVEIELDKEHIIF